MTLWKQECKLNSKNLLIWSICVGTLAFGCLLLYGSIEESMAEMSDMFAGLGSFSEALGMDKISIGTLEGYYAIEIAIILSLGGAMFAAMTGANLVAKEEEGHTSEFLCIIPLSRTRIILEKYLAMTTLIAAFQIVCVVFVRLAFLCMGERMNEEVFWMYHGACFLMNLEIGSICFLLSSIVKKRPTGAALGLTVFLYMVDLICRVVPAIENAKYITPFYFANAADIFTENAVDGVMLIIGMGVTILTLVSAVTVYNRRDLMA